ncbi:NnrS family protein [Pseudomaricurvus sp.]|uniref:NnrS family protein n=1 Tax=Pseudomaricurvus sp. TaxID=2004510 RepID=UPI003F6BB8DD
MKSVFFALGFRPLFFFGSLFSVIAVPLWVAILNGYHVTWSPIGGWLAWHQHELLFGFTSAIIAGFLLTAVKSWTGQSAFSGRPLFLLTLLWLLGRGSWFVNTPLPVLTAVNLLFLMAVAVIMFRGLWSVRQRQNYPVIVILLLLILAEALFFTGLDTGDALLKQQGNLSALWLIAALISLIAGRVIPFFTQRGLNLEQEIIVRPWLDNLLLGGGVVIALAYAHGELNQTSLWAGIVFLLLFIGHSFRLGSWLNRKVFHVPLLWSLYLAYLWLIIACVMMAAWNFGLLTQSSLAVHALSVGGIGGLILSMLSRVTLGHTGRPLSLPRFFVAAYLFINFAAISRVIGVTYLYIPALGVAAFFWSLAFILYLVIYGPMLVRPRVDGKPG